MLEVHEKVIVRFIYTVPGVGLEPTRPKGHGGLSAACLTRFHQPGLLHWTPYSVHVYERS